MKSKIDVELNVTLLKIRDAIANKEFITAQANQELVKYGEWSANFAIPFEEIRKELDTLFLLLLP